MQPTRLLLCLALAGCAGGGGGASSVSTPHRTPVSIADEVGAVDRSLIVGRWDCRELNPFAGRPAQSQTTTYTADGKARSEAIVDLSQQGAGLPGRMLVEYDYDWQVQGDRLAVSNPRSNIRAADDNAASGMMAGLAQMVSRAFVERSKPGTVDVVKLNARELVVRAVDVEEPPVVGCTRG